MLGLYLAMLGFGAVLIGLSLVFGGGLDKGLEIDKSLDLDKSADLDKSLEVANADGDGATADAAGHFWVPFLSMRFWTFATMSAGLAGTLLTLLSVGEVLTAVLAVALGLLTGTGAAALFRALKDDAVSGTTSLRRLEGEEARVLLAIQPGRTGKIVIESMSGRIELPATTQDHKPIPVGASVLVAAVDDGVANVSALLMAKAVERPHPQGEPGQREPER